MKTFKQHLNELYKDYPGKGWVKGTKDAPKTLIQKMLYGDLKFIITMIL